MRRLLLALAAVAALGLAYVGLARPHQQPRLAEIASAIAKRPVGVQCPSFVKKMLNVSGNRGEVQFDATGRPADHTDLSPETCDALARFDGAGWTPTEAEAIHTLTHEAFHLAGLADEATADCYALQTSSWVAQRLGAPRADGRAMAHWYLTHVYPYKPTEYFSGECRNGGRLDLHRDSAVWP